MFYKGIYHLFYQYNPNGAKWESKIEWGHSVSTDLIHWQPLEAAIVPSEWYDINGCWSGSATFLQGGKPVIVYTGSSNASQQVQNMAVPKNLSDPLLRQWLKIQENPIIIPSDGIDGNSFRDPTTGWRGLIDGKWRIAVGSQQGSRGMALLYTSNDFVKWEKAEKPLHSSEGTGMWECPDFYPVAVDGIHGLDNGMVGVNYSSSSVKHVMKASLMGKWDYYTVGRYLESEDVYVPDDMSADNGEKGLRYDYGQFYASKSFFDSHNSRRILWGWVNELDSAADDVIKSWAGLQGIPRTIWLDSTSKSQLMQWPVNEVESLRGKETYIHNLHLSGGSVVEIAGVNAAQVDLEVSFDLTTLQNAELAEWNAENPQQLCSQRGAFAKGGIGPFGFLVLASEDLQEHTDVFFRIIQHRNELKALLCSDQSRSSLQTDVAKTAYGSLIPLASKEKSISLRILIDHSIVESFGGGGKSCITARAYPTLAIGEDARLYVFNNGTSSINARNLRAWDMSSTDLSP
eukprot:Gb_29201 [translate_table: standard]